jgi:hypothetical protein
VKVNGKDKGPTGVVSDAGMFPPDVRMPYRSNGVREYTGGRFHSLDHYHCHIDTRETELGVSREADVEDGSRHGGIHHLLQSHPHARHSAGTEPELHGGPLVRGDRWVPDKSDRSGYRRIDIGAVTLPHDCANHLPMRD